MRFLERSDRLKDRLRLKNLALVYHYITFWIIGHWFVVILSNMNCTPILFRRGEQDHGGNGHLQHPAARRDQGGDHGRTPPLTLLGSKVIVMWQLGI